MKFECFPKKTHVIKVKQNILTQINKLILAKKEVNDQMSYGKLVFDFKTLTYNNIILHEYVEIRYTRQMPQLDAEQIARNTLKAMG